MGESLCLSGMHGIINDGDCHADVLVAVKLTNCTQITVLFRTGQKGHT